MASDVPTFAMSLRLADIALDRPISYAAFSSAPGGYFGKVLCGRYLGLRVAVKILALKPDSDPEKADAEFRREVENLLAVRGTIDRAHVLQRVGSPLTEPCGLRDPARRCIDPHALIGLENAAVIYGVGTEPDLSTLAPGLPPGPAHLIVMEELTGGTLEVSPADVEVRIKVAAGLAKGLTLLAAAHVVHADVKSTNVMRRSPGGEVVLTDYGVGRIAKGGVNEVVYQGSAAGDMLYLAPELLVEDRANTNTFASDVYAYGLVLWCLFSGRRRAFADAAGRVSDSMPELMALLRRVRAGHRPDLTALRSDTPPAVSALIQRCWAQDPATRPTALAIALETEAWLVRPDTRDSENRDLRARIAAAEASNADAERRAAVAVFALGVERAAKAEAERRATEAEARAALVPVLEARLAAAEAQLAAAVRRAEATQAAQAAVDRHAAEGRGGAVAEAPSRTLVPVAVAARPADLSPEHAAWLQSRLPPGGSSSPGAWEEVYRATTHGFSAAAFHARCDEHARLLVLVRAREGGWLFGGFTAVGFTPGPRRDYADPATFLFSLTNTMGNPEKLESQRTGHDLGYYPSYSACFGHDLVICDDVGMKALSWTNTGRSYAASASSGAHPMARGLQDGWLAAEVVAWVA